MEIEGSFTELNQLYDDLSLGIGFDESEDEDIEYQRLQILGLMYDIRHAYQGDRTIKIDGVVRNNVHPFECGDLWNSPSCRFSVSYPLPFLFIDALIFQYHSKYNFFRPKGQRRAEFDSCQKRVAQFFALVINEINGHLSPIRQAKFQRYLELCDGNFPCDHRFFLEKHAASYLRKAKPRREATLLPTIHDLLNYKLSDAYQIIHKEVRQAAAEYHVSVNLIEGVSNIPYPDEIVW